VSWLKVVPGWVWGMAVALVIGIGIGAWITAGHYRPMLDTARDDLAATGAARDNLLALTTEQGVALGELALAGERRQDAAVVAVEKAKAESAPDYAAAGRLQQERTGGDPATAAAAIIDQELGL
jgi:hypothetical protein